MGIGAWAISADRREKVDFPASFSSEAFRAVTRFSAVRETAANSIFFLSAFTWPVWLAILGLMVVHVLVLLLDRGFAPPPAVPENTRLLPSMWQRLRYQLMKSAMLYRLRTGLVSTTVHFLGQYAPGSRKTGTKTKMMNVIALMFGVFLLTMFQASVTVQVLVTTPQSEFGSIADVKNCRIPVSRLCYAGNGMAKRFYTIALAPIPCVKEVGGSPLAVASFDDGFQAVLDGTCDYFYTLQGQVLSQSRGRHCGKLTAVGTQFFATSVSYILPLNSNLTLPISLSTLRMREEDKLVSAQRHAELETCPDITDATLGWDKMKVFFYVAYCGLGVMLVLMVVDRNATPTVEIENLRLAPDKRGGGPRGGDVLGAWPGAADAAVADEAVTAAADGDAVASEDTTLERQSTGWSGETL